ncbi:MAG: DUF3800 domain-containing protein [Antarcticimicrobium sp.]|uniref:DUF3800 domain-containing protein n=1 Tax=Antarcticimicrobium sp. TaxID=2824147 RepID=UPI00260F524D|nr:DUF3800 domain-containing protein [Antarcticimicrobium sp.]MDF1717488.1 DUF3800 domain-containing protein [Antarcticimicrobium sp.]
MNYTVYCDESRHTGGADCKYAVIGGLWVARERRDAISKELRGLKTANDVSAELKWSKVSRLKLEPYKRVVDYYWDCPHLHYRAIVVDQDTVDYKSFHDGDMELGFYKFYYEMLEKWLLAGNDYNILLDFKNNSNARRLPVLRRMLHNYCNARGASVSNLTSIDSKQSNLSQVCDLFTGALSADANGLPTGSPKHELIKYMEHRRGVSPLSARSTSPAMGKFNVFRIALRGGSLRDAC